MVCELPTPGLFGIPRMFRAIAFDTARGGFGEGETNDGCMQKEWTKKEEMGSGGSGNVWRVCKAGKARKKCVYALKKQYADSYYDIEVQALNELQKSGVVPKIHASWTCNGHGYIVMDMLYKCKKMHSFLQVQAALNKASKLGWLQIDVHSGNLMCDRRGKIKLVDWGWGVKHDREKKVYTASDCMLCKQFKQSFTYNDLKILQQYNVYKYMKKAYRVQVDEAAREFAKLCEESADTEVVARCKSVRSGVRSGSKNGNIDKQSVKDG